MTLGDIVNLLECRTLTDNADLSVFVESAGASDLMSDVLAFTKPGSVLLTGLTSIQVVRTAEMLDLKAIVFVRNKQADANAIALAQEMGLPLFSSPYPLYESCGILCNAGMPGSMDGKCGRNYWTGETAGVVSESQSPGILREKETTEV